MTPLPVPGPPADTSAAGLASDLDRAVAELTAALPDVPLTEHHDRLAAILELLQRALDGAHTDR